MSNRIIKPFLQYSNKDKFVKNKKNFVESIIKNRQQSYNKIITRKICIPITGGGGGGGGGPRFPTSIFYMFVVAVSCSISSKLTRNTKKE